MVNVLNTMVAGRAQRVTRRPSHSFHVRTRPFQIAPFFIAPVLPHETMKNLLMQARVVTDPIKNPLIGWWQEYHFFYVKHRDLDGRDDFTAMMLDPDYDLSAYNAAADIPNYHAGPGIDWVQECLERIVDQYFRDEGEAWNVATIGDHPTAAINSNSWLDSAMNNADLITADDVGIVVGVDDTVNASEISAAMRQWELLRAHNLTNQTYEEYLATYGVKPSKVEVHRPELVRSLREWSYPSNTIDPATGTPSSAVSWSIAERADKDRYFAEPGFLFGVTVSRPKVYLSKQTGAAVGLMDSALSWLPAIMRDDPFTSLRSFDAGDGILPANTDAYWVDLRDLLLYGDQFVNFALTDTSAGLIALPTVGLQKKYPSATDADGLFTAASPANQIRQDGVVSLTILGAQVDAT